MSELIGKEDASDVGDRHHFVFLGEKYFTEFFRRVEYYKMRPRARRVPDSFVASRRDAAVQ